MPTKVLVPRLGEGVEEVTITKWLKREGESVKELEALLEVNTDKVDTEIPSPATGVVLKLLIAEGTPAKVGEVLAVIGQPGEQVDALEAASPVPSAPAAEPKSWSAPAVGPAAVVPTGKGELGFVSPVVAKMAAEQGIDLHQVKGTGLGGRITKNDVQAFIQKGGPRGQESARAAISPTVIPQQGDQLIKHSTIRKSIAEHMLASKRTSPHVLTVMEADLSRVVAHRTLNKDAFAREGVHLTFTAYFIAAIASGLKAYPLTNSSWSEEGLVVHQAVNIGMATSLGEDGLIVPVIKGADGLSLLGIARAVNDLSGRARAKKLQPDEVKGGTFTLTNHGVSNSLFAMPIINQPQCGILGAGAMQKRAIVVTDENGNDSIAIRPMVYLSFVFDHRILDGASADWFLAKVKDTLEAWK